MTKKRLLWLGAIFALASVLALVALAQAPLTGHGIATRVLCASTTAAPSSTVYTCSTSPSFTPVSGDFVTWDPGANDLANSTNAPTLNVNGAGAKPIITDGATSLKLEQGDVGGAAAQFLVSYDGTNWQLQGNTGNSRSAYTNTISQGLDGFYSLLRKAGTLKPRIQFYSDSILTCYQQAPCGFGPFDLNNSPSFALRQEICKQFPCYSSGIRPIWRITGTTTVDGGEGGYTATSGTWSTSTLIGPQETTPPANFSGTSLGKLTSGGVLTIAPGQAWSKMIIYCATDPTSNGWTPTVGGAAQSNICTAQPGVATANAVTVTNPTSIATQGATPSTFTLTALGANAYLYGYEAVFTDNDFGVIVDNMGVGAISAVWWGPPTGLAWVNVAAGTPALCILEAGENDAQGGTPRSVTNFNADLQVVATNCQAKGASVLLWIPPPFANTNYTTLQTGMLAYAQTQGWDVLLGSDGFRGGNLVLKGFPDFAAQNAAAMVPLNLTDGTMADGQHPSDIGSHWLFEQIYAHLFGRIPAPRNSYGYGSQISNRVALTSAYTNATTSATSVVGWTWAVTKGQILTIECQGDYQAAATGGLKMQITGPTMTAMRLNLWGGIVQGGSFNAPTVTAVSTLTTGTAVTTATTNFPWKMTLYANPSAAGTIQIQAASVAAVNLTIGVGSYCKAL